MNVVIVEDNKQILRNIRMLLDGEPGVTVSGTFTTAEAALDALPLLSTTILLTDIGLPGMSGIELITKVKEAHPDVEILAYTAQTDRDILVSVLNAGANGYILKGCKPRELIEALHCLHEGGAPLSPQISRTLVREFHPPASAEAPSLLTTREKEILTALEKGLSYQQIADLLTISVHTVHTHVSKMFKKLVAENRKDALVKARRLGIV